MSKLLSLLRSSFILLCRCFRVLKNNFIMYMQNNYGKSYGKRDDSKRNTSDDDIKYDSTWDDEDDNTESSEEKGGVTRSVFTSTRWPGTVRRNIYAAQDMQNFRHRLKDFIDKDSSADEQCEQEGRNLLNLQFYRNQVPSDPDGVYLNHYHNNWFGDYRKLETGHSYIQWLFPIQEQGMNYYAYPLTPKEIKLFHEDEDLKKRLLVSYKLMLDFYGINLVNEETGEVNRAKNWQDRFANLNRNTHNNLRITRILKCLGILGFRHFQAPLVMFFLQETLVNHTLQQVKASVLDYFMFAVLDRAKRKELIKFAFMNYEPKEKFVWCPKKIQRKFLNQKGSPGNSDSESSPSRECEGPPAQLKIQGTSRSHRVSKTQDLYELQTMTDKTSKKNMAVDDPVPTLTGHGVRASVGYRDLSKEQHTEIACCVIKTEEEVSAPDECDISTPDRAKRDSEGTAVSQNSGGDRRVEAVGETNKHVENIDQTAAEGPTAGDENAELSREHGNMSPVSKNADSSGIDMFTNQPISKNLQDVTNEDSGSVIKADNKSDSGRNEENEQSSEYPDVNQQPVHVLATEKTHPSNSNEDMEDHSKSDSGRNEENEQSSEYPDVNQQPVHVLATEKTHPSNSNEDMEDQSISNSNIHNGSNAGGSVLSLSNADSDLVTCEVHEGELKDREDTQHSVNESIRTARSGAQTSKVTDDDDDDEDDDDGDGGVSTGDRSTTAV